MLKIGDFSKFSRVSVKTLRYYDQVGLLKPTHVDYFTGYRYYAVEQLPLLHRILAFKDLGFSLEQIAQLLNEDIPLEQMRGMLRMRQAEIQQHVIEEQERLARVAARLKQIEQEDQMTNQDVVVKRIEPIYVASLRDVVPNYGAQTRLWDELETFLAKHSIRPVGPCLTVYYDSEYREQDVDLEVCELVDKPLPNHPRIRERTLAAVESMACTIHSGSYESLHQTYIGMMRWIEANSYRICGPNREIYLRSMADINDPSGLVTEVQIPVEKT